MILAALSKPDAIEAQIGLILWLVDLSEDFKIHPSVIRGEVEHLLKLVKIGEA